MTTPAIAKSMTQEAADLLMQIAAIDKPRAYAAGIKMGLCAADIARAVGVSRQAVDQWTKHHGHHVAPHKHKALKTIVGQLLPETQGVLTKGELACSLGVHEDTAAIYAKANGLKLRRKPRPHPRADQIRELAAQGLTVVEVARRLNIRPATVSKVKAKRQIQFLRDGRSS